jgi:hypothetical protein
MRGLFRIVIAGAAIAAAGCSDWATAPGNDRSIAPSGRPSLDYDGPGLFGGFRTVTFTLTSAGGSFSIGDLYTLNVPAGAVCSLENTYGPATWDSPCDLLADGDSIPVTATYGFSYGAPVVDFSPDLRFAPEASVTLSTDIYAQILTTFASYFQVNPAALRYFGINYTSDLGATATVDAATDPSVITHINLGSGTVWRRVKHFSGYSVATGKACEVSEGDPDCVATPSPLIDKP